MRQALFTFLSCGFDAASTGAENRVMGTSVEDQRKSLAHVYDMYVQSTFDSTNKLVISSLVLSTRCYSVTYTYEGGIVFSHESKQDC